MLAGVFLLVFSLPCRLVFAAGIRALDEPAITARDPAHDFLIAVTRAGNRLVAVGDHGVIIYSDDDGIHWKQAAVPVSAELTAVGFGSPMNGWAVGHYGVILHTDNGGLTWQTQLTGVQANQMTLAAAQAAVAANDPAPGTKLAMRRAAHFIATGPDVPFLTIWAASANEAMIFGAYRMAMTTNDGGKSWTDVSLRIADAFSHNLYAAQSVGGALFIAGETGLVFRSTDDGTSFQPVPTPATATMLGLVGTGDGGVLTYGVAGQAYRSDDGGKDWASVAVGANVSLTSGCRLSGGEIVLANEYGTLFVSRDHGRNFLPLPQALPMAVFDIVEAADHALIAVGNAGVLRIDARVLG